MARRGVPLAMDAPDPDCYFRDKTLLAGEGHGPLAHAHHVVTLVVHGRLDETFERGTQQCGRCELHYKPPGARHTTSAGSAGVRMLLLGMRGDTLDGLAMPEAPCALGGGVPAARALHTFVSVAEACRLGRPVDRESVRRLVRCLERPARAHAGPRPGWITEAYGRVREQDARRTRLELLSREFGVHPIYLARAFRLHYGRSIGEVRRRTRVDRAVDRLVSGSAPLAATAYELGYSDQSHFTREFKRETGWSPGWFRDAVAGWGRIPGA
ncbi:MAG TPA: AraC family transcriptional regulator [Candidatus Polarisedimenticolaceae bacterium]|nr:AraC family transcriptional regulator [Candidatus Polarisedimenticolaceae bacterium]